MPPRSDNAVDLSHIRRYSREEFLTDVWDYKCRFDNMDHVMVLAPYGGGKTYLLMQLLQHTDLNTYGKDGKVKPVTVVVLVMKQRDSTVSRFAPLLKFHVIRQWPPPALSSRVKKTPPGYILWPIEHDDPEMTEKQQRTIFKRVLWEGYRKGNFIIVCDEQYGLENELALKKEINRNLTKGRSNGCAEWGGTQRPAHVSLWSYQAQHLFIGNDPDEETMKRLSQLGAGIGKEYIFAAIASLGEHEFVYINRDEKSMCIVGR